MWQITCNNLLYLENDLHSGLKEQFVTFRGIYWLKWNIIFISMFSFVYNRMKIRIVVFSSSYNKSFIYIYIEEVGPLPRSTQCCTTMFLQQPRMDKPDTGSRESFSRFSHVSQLPQVLLSDEETEGADEYSVSCDLHPHFQMPLNSTLIL